MKQIFKILLTFFLSSTFVFAQTAEGQKILYTQEQENLRITIEDINNEVYEIVNDMVN